MLTVARLSKYDLWRESLGLGRLQECIYGEPLAPDNVTDGRSSVVYYDRRDLMKDYSIVVHSPN